MYIRGCLFFISPGLPIDNEKLIFSEKMEKIKYMYISTVIPLQKFVCIFYHNDNNHTKS